MRSFPIDRYSVRGKFACARKKQKAGSRTTGLGRQLRIESLENRRLLATVTTNIDFTDPDDGLMTLREAIIATLPGGTVDFAPSLNSATITLNSDPGYREIAFNKSLTIDASMLSSGLTIDAGGGTNHVVGNGDGFRIFNISGGSSTLVTLKNLTLTGGDVTGNGGAISSTSSLNLLNCAIVGHYGHFSGEIYALAA
jgi:hypothetical protein